MPHQDDVDLRGLIVDISIPPQDTELYWVRIASDERRREQLRDKGWRCVHRVDDDPVEVWQSRSGRRVELVRHLGTAAFAG